MATQTDEQEKLSPRSLVARLQEKHAALAVKSVNARSIIDQAQRKRLIEVVPFCDFLLDKISENAEDFIKNDTWEFKISFFPHRLKYEEWMNEAVQKTMEACGFKCVFQTYWTWGNQELHPEAHHTRARYCLGSIMISRIEKK